MIYNIYSDTSAPNSRWLDAGQGSGARETCKSLPHPAHIVGAYIYTTNIQAQITPMELVGTRPPQPRQRALVGGSQYRKHPANFLLHRQGLTSPLYCASPPVILRASYMLHRMVIALLYLDDLYRIFRRWELCVAVGWKWPRALGHSRFALGWIPEDKLALGSLATAPLYFLSLLRRHSPYHDEMEGLWSLGERADARCE